MDKKVKDDNEKKIIEFPKGIPGFEEEKDFILREDAESPFARLDSANNPDLGFVLLRSQLIYPDYLPKVDLAAEEVALLEAGTEDKIDVWSIMTICLSNISKSTVNLRAPLLVNSRTRKGLQIILGDENYSFRQELFSEQKSKEGAAV